MQGCWIPPEFLCRNALGWCGNTASISISVQSNCSFFDLHQDCDSPKTCRSFHDMVTACSCGKISATQPLNFKMQSSKAIPSSGIGQTNKNNNTSSTNLE